MAEEITTNNSKINWWSSYFQKLTIILFWNFINLLDFFKQKMIKKKNNWHS